jgi:hypothetical protein
MAVRAQTGGAMAEDTFSLAQRLTDNGYAALFKESGQDIWQSASQQDFERLVRDDKASPLARFLGSQILLRKDMTFLSRTDLDSLSDVYVRALLGNYTNAMSDWGFLHSNDDLGVMGSLFLVFGERSIPRLLAVLNDDTVVDYVRPAPDVSGFDPTRLQRVRMKDFAALYLSKIKNIPIEFKIPFDERDLEIAALRSKLLANADVAEHDD